MIHVVPKLRTWDELRRPRSRAALRLVRSVHSQSLVGLRMHDSQGAFKQTAAKFNPRIVSGSVSHLGLQVSSRLQDCHSSAHWDTFNFSFQSHWMVLLLGWCCLPFWLYTSTGYIKLYKKKETETVYRSESHHPPSECGHMDRWLPCWTNGSRCHRVCCLQWPECSSIMFYHVQSVSAAKNLLYHPSPAFRAWTNATENGQFRNPSLRVCHARIPPKTLCQGAVTLSTPTGFGSRRVAVSTMSSSANQRTGSWCKIL